MKRILILVAISLFLCSVASAFQGGGGEPTKKAKAKPQPKPTARQRVTSAARVNTTPSRALPQTTLLAGNLRPANQNGMEFVWVPAGTFRMGGKYDQEKPIHTVTISHPFEMGRYEITQEQWQAVMGNNPSYFKDCGKCPVEQVSFEDVQQFIAQLNVLRDGYTYRLPTEAEWEYAARAGSEGDFGNVGNRSGNLSEMGWYEENSGSKTHPVGQKKPNDWGLYDMHGNVFEWVQDWYGDYPKKAVMDPSGPAEGSGRVGRGGSWHIEAGMDFAGFLSSGFRGYFEPDSRYYTLGFRLSRTPS